MGELLCPLPGAGLSAVSLPREAPGGTTPVAAVSTGNLYSAPAVTQEQSICRAWRLLGRAADLLSSEQERSCYPGPSVPPPVPAEAKSWAVSWRPVLQGLRCWILAPGHTAASLQSHHPSPSEFLLEPRSPSTRRLFLCRRRHRQGAPGAAQIPTHRATAGASQCYSLVNACALQPLGSSVHSPGSAGLC